jgi:cation diffusion facilitator CzcD-associated flavoprotein CzcO
VPSHLHSFSFAPNPDWSSTFSPQPEILDYLRDCAERHGVMPRIRFNCELRAAEWDEDAALWRLETSQGELTADVAVAAQGPLSDPSNPDLPGLDNFEGTTFHSAPWDHEHDLEGERVGRDRHGRVGDPVRHGDPAERRPDACIPVHGAVGRPASEPAHEGVGAGAVQGLPARAAGDARRDLLGAGVLRAPVPPLAARQARREDALKDLHSQVEDPVLSEKLRPRYAMGCKRILPTDEWYPALVKPNVEVVTEGVREVLQHSIVSADGSEREVDAIIFGTGFHVSDIPVATRIRDRDGRTLAETWKESPSAYKGSAVAVYPNIFFLFGPNTGPRPQLDRAHWRKLQQHREGSTNPLQIPRMLR